MPRVPNEGGAPGLMRVSPVEHDIPPDYQYRALHSGWALQRAWHRARLDCVAHLLPPAQRAPSLDAAAGSGIVAWRFAPAPVVSTDIRVAACRFIRDNTAGGPAIASTLSSLPFRAEAFQQIYLLEVIEHLRPEDALHVLRELRRVSHPRGRCLITTPNYASHWSVLEQAIDTLRLTPRMAGEQHVAQYTAQSLSQTVSEAGWNVLRAGSFNLLAPLAGMLSTRVGSWATRRETAGNLRAGALLYLLCEPAA